MLIKRQSVLDAAAHELRPLRYHRQRVGILRQQTPEAKMMPAQVVPAGIAMLTNTPAQLFDLVEQLFPAHQAQILVHSVVPYGLKTSDTRSGQRPLGHSRRPSHIPTRLGEKRQCP